MAKRNNDLLMHQSAYSRRFSLFSRSDDQTMVSFDHNDKAIEISSSVYDYLFLRDIVDWLNRRREPFFNFTRHPNLNRALYIEEFASLSQLSGSRIRSVEQTEAFWDILQDNMLKFNRVILFSVQEWIQFVGNDPTQLFKNFNSCYLKSRVVYIEGIKYFYFIGFSQSEIRLKRTISTFNLVREAYREIVRIWAHHNKGEFLKGVYYADGTFRHGFLKSLVSPTTGQVVATFTWHPFIEEAFVDLEDSDIVHNSSLTKMPCIQQALVIYDVDALHGMKLSDLIATKVANSDRILLDSKLDLADNILHAGDNSLGHGLLAVCETSATRDGNVTDLSHLMCDFIPNLLGFAHRDYVLANPSRRFFASISSSDHAPSNFAFVRCQSHLVTNELGVSELKDLYRHYWTVQVPLLYDIPNPELVNVDLLLDFFDA